MIDLTDDMIIKNGNIKSIRDIILLIFYVIIGLGIFAVGIYASVNSKSVVPLITFGIMDLFVIGISFSVFSRNHKEESEWLKKDDWYVFVTSIQNKKVDETVLQDKTHYYYNFVLQKDGIIAQVDSSLYNKVSIGDSLYVVIRNNGKVINLYPVNKYHYIGRRLKVD